MHTLLGLTSDELEEVHARHGNHHIFATCKQLAATRPAWLEPLKVVDAARFGKLQLLRWMHSAGLPLEHVCRNAAGGGRPWGQSTCESAAFSGHLEVLQWARANGCPE